MERKLLLNSPLLCCYGCILYDVTYETMNGVNADIESDGNYGYTENEELNMKPISFDRFYKYDKKSPKIIFLLYLLCCGSVILSLIDTCFIAYLWVAKSSNTAPEVRSIYHGNRVCVPCDMLDDVSLSTRDKTLSTLCCFSNQTEATAAKVTEAIYRQSQRGSWKNSFHVYYYAEEMLSNRFDRKREITTLSPTTRSMPVRYWVTEGETARLGNGITFDSENGQFTIGVSGNYMIYSHISFQPSRHILQQRQMLGLNNTFVFSHSVLVRNKDGDKYEPLRDSAEARCPTRDKYGGLLYACHVTSLGAMLWLRRDDILTLEVAPVDYLLGDSKSTYFGLFLIE